MADSNCPTTTDLTDAVKEAAQSPRSASFDGNSTTAQSVSDIIEADRYCKTQDASAAKKTGLRFARLRTQGTV